MSFGHLSQKHVREECPMASDIQWNGITDQQLLAVLRTKKFVRVNVRLLGDGNLECAADLEGDAVIKDVYMQPDKRDWES
jgi:hypothetical protein